MAIWRYDGLVCRRKDVLVIPVAAWHGDAGDAPHPGVVASGEPAEAAPLGMLTVELRGMPLSFSARHACSVAIVTSHIQRDFVNRGSRDFVNRRPCRDGSVASLRKLDASQRARRHHQCAAEAQRGYWKGRVTSSIRSGT